MHELSVAHHLVEIAEETARRAGAVRVTALHLRIGALSCVQREALEFCFDLATQGTMLHGAKLHITEVPVEVYCSACDRILPLPSIQRFRCPRCGVPTGDIRRGRELELDRIEIEEGESPAAADSGANDGAEGVSVGEAATSTADTTELPS